MTMQLCYYASIGKTGKVLHLLHKGVDVNAMNSVHETALFSAAKFGRLSTVKKLLKYGADPNIMNVDGVNPVLIAAFREHLSCLQVLLEAGGSWFTAEDAKLKYQNDVYNTNNFRKYASSDAKDLFHAPPVDITLDSHAALFDINGTFSTSPCKCHGIKMMMKIRQGFSRMMWLTGYELDKLRSIRHPNVLLPFCTSEVSRSGLTILLTEEVQFGTLYEVLYQKKEIISSAFRKQIVLQIITACVFIHDKTIVHNFINSSSIFLTNRLTVRLGNFEYCLGSFSEMLTVKKDKQFQLKYMAPETILNNETSSFTDVYSFGCLTWEVFTQTQPWSWLDDEELVVLAKEGIETKHSVRLPMQPCWPSYVKQIVERCCRNETELRPSFKDILAFSTTELHLTSSEAARRRFQRQNLVDNNETDVQFSLDKYDESDDEIEYPTYVPSTIYLRHDSLCQDDCLATLIPGDALSYNRLEKKDVHHEFDALLQQLCHLGETEMSILAKVKLFFEKEDQKEIVRKTYAEKKNEQVINDLVRRQWAKDIAIDLNMKTLKLDRKKSI